MKETVLIPLGMLLLWLSQDKPLSQRLHPGYWPEANGKRYLTLREERRWQEALQQNYIASAPSKGLPAIKIKTIHCGEGYLHAQVIQQLQTGCWMKPSGEFNLDAKNSSKTKGRHLVIPLTLGDFSLYLKIFPEMPGIEYAASRLAQLLVGFGLPLVEIARIEVGKAVYPVLLSQSISGNPLDEVLKEATRLPLEPRSFSEMMLLNLFLSPEDGKPDNFILARRRNRITTAGEPRLSLVNVDNDRSFYPSVIEEGENQFTVMVKTIVYCFDEMQSVFDPNLAKELQALEPFEVLQQWLGQLAVVETALATLFTKDEIKAVYEEQMTSSMLKMIGIKQDIPETSLIPVVLRDKLVSELYIQLVRLKTTLGANKPITHFALLNSLQPWLGKWYEDLFKANTHAIARFNAGPGVLYGKGSKDTYVTNQTLVQTLTTLHGKPIKLETYLQSEQQLITMALAELAQIKAQDETLQGIIDKLTAGNEEGLNELQRLNLDDLKERVIAQLNFDTMRMPSNKLFKVMETIRYTHLTINHSELLSIDQLKRILRNTRHLRRLTLRGTPMIDTALWDLLAKYSNTLEQLHVDGLPRLEWPSGKKEMVTFNTLNDCLLANCPRLKKVSLRSPTVEKFSLSHCPNVVTVILAAPCLTQALCEESEGIARTDRRE